MMKYGNTIDELLRPSVNLDISVNDLFCGCGGLSLGFEASGFKTLGFDGCVDAVATYRKNLIGEARNEWLNEDFECPSGTVLVGGPPCQPFSELGLRRGAKDERNCFPIFLKSVRVSQPRIWLFENVPGLLRQTSYFSRLMKQLAEYGYNIDFRILDASEYGVPQRRRRLVVVGCKNGRFEWPAPVPGRSTVADAIGSTMRRHTERSRFLTPSMEAYVARYEAASKCVNPRDLSGDRPARTVTCRNLFGATGDMLRVKLPDGRRRMLTVREAARLQSFPGWFGFAGGESSRFTQIGNAVPPLLSYHLAQAVKKFLRV